MDIHIKSTSKQRKRWWTKALSKEYKKGFEQIDWKKKPKVKKK
tara:strand:+ start:955 stop:1083 length:129 start_codon:yes stop_codon:yes gene_type:complete